MKKYRVYIADKLTKIPLATYEVSALGGWHAKAVVFRDVCRKDRSYIVTASKVEE